MPTCGWKEYVHIDWEEEVIKTTGSHYDTLNA